MEITSEEMKYRYMTTHKMNQTTNHLLVYRGADLAAGLLLPNFLPFFLPLSPNNSSLAPLILLKYLSCLCSLLFREIHTNLGRSL